MADKKKFNKAAEIRKMLAANPEIKFVDVEKAFEAKGYSVAAAQFYTLKKNLANPVPAPKKDANKISIKRKAKPATTSKPTSSKPVVSMTSVAAKASSAVAFEPKDLLQSRKSLSKAIRQAALELGRQDIVNALVADIMDEVFHS